MPGALLWGWDDTNKKWIPLQVDENGYVKVDMSNINLGHLADVDVSGVADDDFFYYDQASGLWKPKKVEGSNLSQTFGSSATRLRNIIIEPIAGNILRMLRCAASPFSAVINGTPSATSVVYDGEANENMFNGLTSGSAFWGRIILHNTTRGNSRKVVSVNLTTNTITTESSTDDWADNDDITAQSQTNAQAGFIDVDVSGEIPATTEGIFLFAGFDDYEDAYDANRYLMFHPFEAYNSGKRQWVHAEYALDKSQMFPLLKLIDQKFTMLIGAGSVSVNVVLSVTASVEFADT